MRLSFDVPFDCPNDIRPYLEKVFAGEYAIPGFFHSPKVIDLGANYGAFSVWASHVFPHSEIFAYEPHPETFKGLQANMSRYGNVKTHNWGIGTEGTRVLSNGLRNSGEASFHTVLENPTPTGVHCEVRSPLTLPEADILKMDIEGCEMEVLGPLIEAGRRFTVIMLEHHNHGLRRAVDALLTDYEIIGSEMYNICGLGVVKYMHRDILPEAYR